MDIRIGDIELDKKKILDKINSICKTKNIKLNDIKINLDYPQYQSNINQIKQFQKICKNNNLSGELVKSRAFNEAGILGNIWKTTCLNIGPGPYDKCHSKDEYVDINWLPKILQTYKDIIMTFK